MRAVAWLSAIFASSVLLGTCCWGAAIYMTGGDRWLEGLLGLAMIVAGIAFFSSGYLLFFIIGPAVLEQRFRR
jgi:hypothetical protein